MATSAPAAAIAPAAPFVGWLRTRATGSWSRWQPVAGGPTEAACWQALLAVPRVGTCDLVVLPAGQDANEALTPVRAAVAAGGRPGRGRRRCWP